MRRPQNSVVFLPVGLPVLASFEESVSTVMGVVGSKELVSTVMAPPRIVVWRPPLAVVRVAQPDAMRRTTRAVAERSRLVFMGREVGRWAAGVGFASVS